MTESVRCRYLPENHISQFKNQALGFKLSDGRLDNRRIGVKNQSRSLGRNANTYITDRDGCAIRRQAGSAKYDRGYKQTSKQTSQ